MSTPTSPLHNDPTAQERLINRLEARCDSSWFQEVKGCVPQLVALLSESPDEPVAHQSASVRRILNEQTNCDEGGDAPDHCTQVLEQQVQAVVEELESLRQATRGEGQWSEMPVTPLMCG